MKPRGREAPGRATARQREYLCFIQAFTDRWGMPPSFEEIARHFGVSSPSVNGMVKSLEARGFLARVPGAARTLRVTVPLEVVAPKGGVRPTRAQGASKVADVAARFASLLIERLVPALRGVTAAQLACALDAVDESLDLLLRAEGASEDERRSAHDALLRIAGIAQGSSPETRPGRRHPWWRRPRGS